MPPGKQSGTERGCLSMLVNGVVGLACARIES